LGECVGVGTSGDRCLGHCGVTNQAAGALIAAMTWLGRWVWLCGLQGKRGKGLETLVIACGYMPKGS